MTISVFSSYPFERPYLAAAVEVHYDLNFLEAALALEMAAQAAGNVAVVVFVNDDAFAPMLEKLWTLGMPTTPLY